MLAAVDIGNTNLKALTVLPGGAIRRFWNIPAGGEDMAGFVSKHLLPFVLQSHVYPKPISWRFIQTGSLDWQKLRTEIRKVRPKDKFKLITHKHIPLKLDVDFPQKTGIDRLIAAFSAGQIYGSDPMLIVDAGSAITVDLVQDGTFYGGAILPGLSVLTQVYPRISEKLPQIKIPMFPQSNNAALPQFPGKNTEDALLNGLYWGTVGAIRQFYDTACVQSGTLRLVLTGGDAEYLLHGLNTVFPAGQIVLCDTLVVEGIANLP